MLIVTERQIHYGLEKKLCTNEKNNKKSPKNISF